MKMSCLPAPGARVLTCLLVLATIFPSPAADSKKARKLFTWPPREYATAPLWVWNDLLTEQQIRDTLRDLAAQKVKQVFVHPRPGLMTPYLGDDWFRLWKTALDQARRLDMNVWIYDENSYPSGFAGGLVPDAMPSSRGQGLAFQELKSPPKWSNGVHVAVFRLEGDQAADVTAKVRAGETLPEGRYLAAMRKLAANTPWNAGRSYVNLITPGVTEKFLEITMEPYLREIGSQFGKRVPGVFTDEPNTCPAGRMAWSDTLAQEFQQRWGYSLLENLASLSRDVGDWRKVRHNYFQLVLELFIDRWARPYHDWCEQHSLEFTGHYWEHDWPMCVGGPDNMAMYAWHQRPSIDCLMNQYREDVHAQFGNARMVRELSSVANQLGRQRTLCELYGAGGWDLRFEDMKRIGDWLAVLGVNTMDEHLSYITIRGARKRDHPQSFSYHEPWWEGYHVIAQYLTRVCAALSQGEQINSVLVLEPTTTAWMYNADGLNHPRLKEIGDSFQQLINGLEAAQVEYDIGCEDILARWGAFDGATLKVGRRAYSTVVIPPFTENLNRATVKLLQDFAKSGGRIILSKETELKRVEGAETDAGISGMVLSGPRERFAQDVVASLPGRLAGGFSITRPGSDQGILFHHRRQLKDGELVFLVNTSIEAPSTGLIRSLYKGVEKWDLQSGETEPYPFEAAGNEVRTRYELPPSGSLLLLFTKKAAPPLAEPLITEVRLPLAGQTAVRRVEPNVLTLDYVDITAGGETRVNQYFYQASQFAFQKNGLDRNPWDNAVQFKDELIRRTFPAGSGFEASYKFTVESSVPTNLAIVIERPDLYEIACNGQKVVAPQGEWWLDKAFGRIPLTEAARVGDNVVTLRASPFTIYHELEPAYVLGDFTLKATKKGFVIGPVTPLNLGKWNEQGHPFYAKGVAYSQEFTVARRDGRFKVALPKWYGSVAGVTVNGKPAGYIAAPPWECDVTEYVRRGLNTVEVKVIGTLKNTLGPHHGKPGLGSAWPAMFHNGPKDGPPPGADYATVGYGLFEPFLLKQILKR